MPNKSLADEAAERMTEARAAHRRYLAARDVPGREAEAREAHNDADWYARASLRLSREAQAQANG